MSKVTLNGTEYEGVQPQFLDGISTRLTSSLIKQRSNRVVTDQLSVTSELIRLYGNGIMAKVWYKDFVMQFCRDRKIPCNPSSL